MVLYDTVAPSADTIWYQMVPYHTGLISRYLALIPYSVFGLDLFGRREKLRVLVGLGAAKDGCKGNIILN